MTIKLFSLASLMVFATVLFIAIVILEDPPAFIAYIFGALNGASIVGVAATWLIRRNQS